MKDHTPFIIVYFPAVLRLYFHASSGFEASLVSSKTNSSLGNDLLGTVLPMPVRQNPKAL